MPTQLNKKQISTLQHMLGMTDFLLKYPNTSRNYAAVTPGDSEFIDLLLLDLVECYHQATDEMSYDLYRCTPKGIIAATIAFMENRFSKSKRRYSRYLDIKDCYHRLTFKEFLTNEEFKDIRDNA